MTVNKVMQKSSTFEKIECLKRSKKIECQEHPKEINGGRSPRLHICDQILPNLVLESNLHEYISWFRIIMKVRIRINLAIKTSGMTEMLI